MMKLLYSSLSDVATITASSEAAGYAASNVAQQHLVLPWRSTGDTAEWLKFDLGVARLIPAIIIAAHNLTAGTVLKVEANDTDSWTTPALSVTLNQLRALPWELLGGVYRWWRVTIADPNNAAGYVQVGRIMLCLAWDPDEEIDGAFTDDTEDLTIKSRSESGQTYSDPGFQVKHYTFSLGITSNLAKRGLLDIFAIVGTHTPFVLVPYVGEEDKLAPLYCTFAKAPRFDHRGGWTWGDSGIEVVEEL